VRLSTSFLFLASAATAAAQSTLVGSVTSDSAHKHPLIGVEVSIPSLHKGARTDSTGTFRIDGLTIGSYAILVRAVGYQPTIDDVSIDVPDGNLRDFVLPPLAQPLDTVRTKSTRVDYISPALRGFEDRRKSGQGHYLSEAQLRTMDNQRVSDVISRFPGVSVGRNATKSVAMSSRTGGFCRVYLDGIEMKDMSARPVRGRGGPQNVPPNLNDFSVDQLAGMEFYGGGATAPLGFGQGGCLLLLWTRER